MPRSKTTRAVAKRTITAGKRKSKSVRNGEIAPAEKATPVITLNEMYGEMMVLIVIPGYGRVPMAIAHTLVALLFVASSDYMFHWMDAVRIGPGDRLHTCTTVEARVLPGTVNAPVDANDMRDRVRALGELAVQSTIDAVKVVDAKCFNARYRTKRVIHAADPRIRSYEVITPDADGDQR